MRWLDLFSGIGGFALGLRWAGFPPPVAFCECDPFCQRVLRKHWPDVPIFDDVRELDVDAVGSVEFICGGFPCQDISYAGKKTGIDGERSGLWREFHRLLRDLRPDFALVENVSALLSGGLGCVLGDLASVGFDAEWHCIPADAVGAPHIRDRIWILAYSSRIRRDARRTWEPLQRSWMDGQTRLEKGRHAWNDGVVDDEGRFVKPGLPLLANGVPYRVERITSTGNAVVPQVIELFGHAILAARQEGKVACPPP